jgi:membrane protease YdiL (CAAX protease family)
MSTVDTPPVAERHDPRSDSWLRRHRLVAFFVLSYVLAWWSWPLSAMGLMEDSFWPAGPLVAAIVVLSFADGRAGWRDLGARLIRWRVGWQWYAVGVLLPLSGLAAAAALNVTVWDAPSPVFADLAWSGFALAFVVRWVNPLDGPLGEEPGWRGYALPRMQATMSPLVTAVVLGLVVAGWHLPLVFYDDLGVAGLPGTFVITIVYVWFFNHTNGSLLMALLFHVSQGSITFSDLGFAGADLSRMDALSAMVWAVIAIGVLVLDRRAWRRAPRLATYPVADRPAPARVTA